MAPIEHLNVVVFEGSCPLESVARHMKSSSAEIKKKGFTMLSHSIPCARVGEFFRRALCLCRFGKKLCMW